MSTSFLDILNASSDDHLGMLELPVFVLSKNAWKQSSIETKFETNISGRVRYQSKFLDLFLRNAPSKYRTLYSAEGTPLENDPEMISLKIIVFLAPFLTPKGFTFLEVKAELLDFFKYLQNIENKVVFKNPDMQNRPPYRYHLQICNEVIKGKRAYSINFIEVSNENSIVNDHEIQEEIRHKIAQNPVLNAFFLLMATRLRKMGRWSWYTLTAQDIFGGSSTPY